LYILETFVEVSIATVKLQPGEERWHDVSPGQFQVEELGRDAPSLDYLD
jgi:hypothetical protein